MAPGVSADDASTMLHSPQGAAQCPPKMVGSLAWDAASLQEADYSYKLTGTHVQEINRALGIFKDYELDGPDISPKTFPLPTLGPILEGFAREIHYGRGFVLITGLEPDLYSDEDNALIFLGMSSYIGLDRGMQDNRGRMMVHVSDQGKGPAGGTKASNKPSPFHTEFFCDILSLYVRGEPASGGNIKIASSWQVYNDLCKSRPDIIRTLQAPDWTFERYGHIFQHSAQTHML
ncbi:hypothetical protein jhhlp_007915 [Lomentospora prolificans]|uniref:TauD/TfdA-like domain-containing protein n=1 Tax=Lomentospora prolificans TaxID=41688 RepID=A0A2N3N0Y7_9PEZI|nr:hypothetical protein jhhlp_007915 [Lomentospora prolificans]